MNQFYYSIVILSRSLMTSWNVKTFDLLIKNHWAETPHFCHRGVFPSWGNGRPRLVSMLTSEFFNRELFWERAACSSHLSSTQPTCIQSCTLTLILPDYPTDSPVPCVSDLLHNQSCAESYRLHSYLRISWCCALQRAGGTAFWGGRSLLKSLFWHWF